MDLLPGWPHGADTLAQELTSQVPWRAERRHMYEREVDVPRLLSFYKHAQPLPHPVVDEARAQLSAYHAPTLAEPFTTAGPCSYRDGRDSIAWHGNRIGRSSRWDTLVAILPVGDPRDLTLRPRGSTTTAVRLPLGHGDLLVMGGSCQHTWEHAIPKARRALGSRISIQFRPHDVG